MKREELQQLVELCLRYRVTLVSDEVHADLVYAPHQHTVTATIGSEIAQQSITFFAPSKTFNIAGLQTAYAVIPNPELRHWLVHCAGLGFNDGPSFGTGGTGFQRVNFGTPRSFIMEAIERLDTAITELKI